MPESREFVDFYELLEVSPRASSETIERVFRHLAKRCHPDSADHADVKRFSLLVEACETLLDVAARARYDREYEQHQQQLEQLVRETSCTGDDSTDRHRLLSLFYAQRRRDRRQPGIGSSTLEHAMGLPAEVLEFHLWYFREKGWIHREESGLLAITAAGVDQIEADLQRSGAESLKRIRFDGTEAGAALQPCATAATR